MGMRNKEIKSKHEDTEIEWTFLAVESTNSEKREMRGIMCEIGVRTLWDNFSYRFGNKIYHQKSGGPIQSQNHYGLFKTSHATLGGKLHNNPPEIQHQTEAIWKLCG